MAARASRDQYVDWTPGVDAASKYDGTQIQVWGQSHAGFTAQTTNQMHYQPFTVQPAPPQSARPETKTPPAAHFYDSTTHKDAFKKWPIQRTAMVRGPPATLGREWGTADSWITTHAASYMCPPKGDRAALTKPPAMTTLSTDPLDGSTTYKDAYRRHAFGPRRSAAPVPREKPPTTFEGVTTHASHYLAHPPVMPERARAPQPRSTNSGQFDGETTHRMAFKEIKLPPMTNFTLGAQVVGGRFYTMIRAGARIPAQGKQTFTTTCDDQTNVDIVVIAKNASSALELGHFRVCGIPRSKAGVPRIPTTFQLLESTTSPGTQVLRVKSFDESNPRSTTVWLGDMP